MRDKQSEFKKGSIPDGRVPGNILKRWKTLAIIWPLLCFIFAGIILSQPGQSMDERIADTGFTIIPLVFFAIGMSMRRRLLKERGDATVRTKATVISRGRITRPGKRYFYPVYEFQAGGITYKVTSHSGYNVCFVTEGRQVDLYYASENPQMFYVPIMQKHDRRVSAILCGVGILWPLIGLFAPQIRELFSFLE